MSYGSLAIREMLESPELGSGYPVAEIGRPASSHGGPLGRPEEPDLENGHRPGLPCKDLQPGGEPDDDAFGR